MPGFHVDGYPLRGASGNGDILVYMKKDSKYILVSKLDGNSYELREVSGKVWLIKRSHAGAGWEPSTAYELLGDTFVESDKYDVSKRNNIEWFDVNARVSSLYDLGDEVTVKIILERSLEEGKKKSGHYSSISVHVYQSDKLAVDFEGITDENNNTAEKVIAAAKIDNVAKRNQEQIIVELKKGNINVVRSMIENGTQVDARDIVEWEGDKVKDPTLLMLAACRKDCDINMTDDDQISLVKYLLNKGADVNAYVPWGESVLTFSIGQGSEEKTEEETNGGASRLPIVKLLLEHGAKTNTGAAYEHIMGGNTYLTLAAIRGYYQIVSLLFQYDAREGLYQAYKFAKENNHNQTAKLIQDKFWNNYKSDCLTNSGFIKSVMIGEPVDTENYAISIVQGKRSTSDSYINTAICIFDKQNGKIEIAEPNAFKKFPFALAALSQNKELQQNNQTSFCNEARQLLSREPDLPINNKFADCIFNSKFISTIVIGEPTDTENYKILITQGAHSVTDDSINTAICVFNKETEAVEIVEPNVFKTYPFAISALNFNSGSTQLANNQLACSNEIHQLLYSYIRDNNKLTRNQAAMLILRSDKLSLKVIKLREQGFEKGIDQGMWKIINIDHMLTPKGTQYFESVSYGDVRIKMPAHMEINVTGITSIISPGFTPDTEKFKEVQFSWRYIDLDPTVKQLVVDNGNTGYAYLQLFDDGWRVIYVSIFKCKDC